MREYLDQSGDLGTRVTVLSKVLSFRSLMARCHRYLKVYLGHCQTSMIELFSENN